MIQRIIALGSSVLLLMVSWAHAAESAAPLKAYVAAVPYYMEPDGERGAEEGMGIQLTYGHLLSGQWYLEGTIAGSNLETDSGGGTDFYQTTGGLDLVYRFGDPLGFSPFVLAGGGAAYNDVFPDDDDETTFFANVGLGFVSSELGDSGLRLRGDARFLYDDFGDGMNDWRVGLGFEIPLGRTRVETREVTVVKEVIKEVPAADSDGDGVIDGVDRCPNTLAGAKVDQYGCIIEKQTLKLEGVHFEFDSAKLTADSLQILQGVAQSLNGQPDLRVEVAGHTDAVGSDDYNLKLSGQRVQSVRDYLVSLGVDGDRLSSRGYGESQPVASNETEEGRAQNRRVEFRIAGAE